MTCAPKKVGPGGPKAFDQDATKPPAGYFWNIAEKNCDGVKVLITPAQYRKIEQLYTALASKVGCGGGVRGVYTPGGKAIKDLKEFKDGEDYIVVPTGDAFSKARIPLKLAAKLQGK
ncbi:Serine/threonine-protein kinase dclk1 [Tritrichomonas musculus]|uniref:Serine/threonine-protein kinase dclk1 n=1 Tax=Tritrichomonas musculus TaxID=1915356 RepID=A0ABR2IBI8_9EUKA